MEGVARLAPGVTMEEATSAVSGLSQRLENDFAQTNKAWGVRLIPVLDEQLGYYQPALIVLFGAVGLLMIIGCLNVASLLLTRALSREREIAVRTALGASPRHLIVQLLAEALVLSVGGALVGTLAAWAALPLMVSATQVDIPRLDEVAINLRVLGFALFLAVGTTVVFGLVPAITLIRRSLTADLKTGDRGSSKASRTIYKGLVVGEVALACALLIGSGLLVGTVARMTSVPLGVGNTSVVTSSIQLSGSAYPDWASVNTSHSAILEHLRLQPGIRAAGAANFLPLEAGWRVSFAIDGEVPAQASDLPQAQFHSVSPGHFEAIGARLVSGRFLTDQDRPEAIGAVVVNQAFADRYLRTTDRAQPVLLTAATGIGPLGANVMPQLPIEIGGSTAQASRFDIVGVVADIRNVPLGQEVEPAVYFSARQFPFRAMFLTIDAPDVGTAVTALRNTLRAVAPGIPLTDALTWQDRFRVQTAEPRLLMTVLVFFGSLAALLAALGVYGLFSWTVALRQRELAIRLTLGARPMAIGASVLRQGTLLVVVGLGLGWGIIQLAAPAMRQVLFEVTANDPGAVAPALGLLLVASVGACLPPAIRAMRVNPIDGLRD
jgi:predicted permease